VEGAEWMEGLSLEVLEVDILWPRWVARIGVTRSTQATSLSLSLAGVVSDGRPSVHGWMEGRGSGGKRRLEGTHESTRRAGRPAGSKIHEPDSFQFFS